MEKFELQRGLQRHMETVATLSDSQAEADSIIAELKAERGNLRDELQAYQNALSQQVRISASVVKLLFLDILIQLKTKIDNEINHFQGDLTYRECRPVKLV